MKTRTLLLIVIAILFLACLAVSAAAQAGPLPASATFQWDANTETDLAGYRLYYGTASRKYDAFVAVVPSASPQATVSVLTPGVTYFFAVTAYNTAGLESDQSNEVTYQPPLAPSALAVLPGGPGRARLQFVYAGGAYNYRIYANGTPIATGSATSSPVVADLPGLVPGVTYSVQVALVDPVTGTEHPKSVGVSLSIPTIVGNVRRK